MKKYNCTIVTSDECINNSDCKNCDYGEKVLSIGDKIQLIKNYRDWITNTAYFDFTKKRFPEPFTIIGYELGWYKIQYKYSSDIYGVNKLIIDKYFKIMEE